MTIAAGLLCDEGVVLCADTQETIPGYVKTDTEKMRTFLRPIYNISFTGAGDSDLIEMTIEEIDRRLTLENPTALWPILKAIKDALADVFKKRIGPYGVFSPETRPEIPTLLIVIQFSAATLLYKASGTKLRRLHESDCIGMGVILGKSLIGQLFDPKISLTQSGLIAVYIFNQVKRWVDTCGGKSDILLIFNRDKNIIRIPTDKVEELEKHFDEFSLRVRPVLMAAADATVPHSEYEKAMHQFAIDVLALRGKFMEMKQFFRSLYQLAGIPLPKDLEEMIAKVE